jgi:hypothetical protein
VSRESTQSHGLVQPTSAGTPRTSIDGIAEYGARFHSALGDVHAAASPLGAWLLLAVVAPLATGRHREEIEQVLGCPADEAAAFASSLLTTRHPYVATAMGIWTDQETLAAALRTASDPLPPGLDVGPVPSQAAADTWAREATLGLIDRFPLGVDPRTLLLLASALAVQAPWDSPFDIVPVEELGRTPWSRDVKQVMDRFVSDDMVIARTESAGLVGVLVSSTKRALRVVSVIADPSVLPPAVIAAAHEVALGRAERCSLFDLPLGPGHAWDITEHEVMTWTEGDRFESSSVLIPAWEASIPAVDLFGDADFGFDVAAAVLAERLSATSGELFAQAAQVTTAKFDRWGFSAASVTALAMIGMAGGRELPRARGLQRDATVRFSRPFGVVAVAASPRELEESLGLPMSGQPEPEPWRGVPVFTAWVTRPTEPQG